MPDDKRNNPNKINHDLKNSEIKKKAAINVTIPKITAMIITQYLV